MARKCAVGLVCIMLALSLCSCSRTKTKEEILREAEQYTENIALDTAYDYQKDMGKWLEPETSYEYDENGDTSDEIVRLTDSNFILQKDRLYFQVGKPTATSFGADFWVYVSLKTGEKHYLCPDPLCEHTKQSACQYLDLAELTFHPDSESTLYMTKNISVENKYCGTICKIDLDNNKISELYRENLTDSEARSNRFDLMFINENTLYFTDRYTYREDNGEGEVVFTDEVYFKALDLSETVSAGNARILDSEYDGKRCVYVLNDQIFGIDSGVAYGAGRFYVTDMNFGAEKTILEYEEGSHISGLCYDQNTEEFYLLVSSNDMHISSNAENGKGKLYCLDRDFHCEEVPMPSEQILSFQLTNQYIYYTIYDPIVYGMSPRGIEATDESGNKIYRVSRDDTTVAELAFDGHEELRWRPSGYTITGDYLYMDYASIAREGGLVWFKAIGSTARINMKDNTIRWINLD